MNLEQYVRYYTKRLRNLGLYDRSQLHAMWEHKHLRRLMDHLNVDCVFDIGANEGQYAVSLRKKALFEGFIFSFEPDPKVAALARAKATAMGDQKWIVFDIAVSDTDGTTTFNLAHDSQGSSLSTPSAEAMKRDFDWIKIENTITVQCERLSVVFDRLKSQYGFSRPFLKMDTQGFDVNIVRGSPETMPLFVGLQSELAVVKLYSDSIDFREALAEYEKHGFVLSAFVPNNEGHFPQMVETDCIMVRGDLVKK